MSSDIHLYTPYVSCRLLGDDLRLGTANFILFIPIQLLKNFPYNKNFQEKYSRFFTEKMSRNAVPTRRYVR
jgi:hypothetical protein